MTERASLWGALRSGCFPHQLSSLIDNPLRRLVIKPETLADRLSLTPSSQILEVGPGSGYFSLELARRVPQGRLELLDVQPEMIDKAMRKFGRAPPPNVGWTAADAGEELPFDDNRFDIVLLITVLGEISGREQALRSFLRVLRPGGTLAVHEHLPDPDFLRLQRLRAMVEAAGFEFMRHQGPAWNYTALFVKP